MVAINFKKEFARLVESGEKRQTIRPTARCKPGDKLQLYTGMRTKSCRKLRDATCTTVSGIQVGNCTIVLGGESLSLARCEAMARADGFEGVDAFVAFFRQQYGLPFTGKVIEWAPAQ
jgi:hypothetical protein